MTLRRRAVRSETDPDGGSCAAAGVAARLQSATARSLAGRGKGGAPDSDDMRETREFFHQFDLEDVERASDYRRMGANVSWDEGDDN